MARTYLFTEGFDDYSSIDQLALNFDYVWTAGSGSLLPTGGRFGGQGMRLPTASAQRYSKGFPVCGMGASDEFYLGFWFKMPTGLNGGSTHSVSVGSGDVDDATDHMGIRFNGSSFILFRGSSTALATGAKTDYAVGTWYWLEIRVRALNSGGQYELRVNGVVDINYAGDCAASADQGVRYFVFSGSNAGSTYDIDDVIAFKADGTSAAQFLGPKRIDTLHPDGNGATNDGTPNTGTNYGAVDDTAPDGDTTYVSLSTAGHRELYTFGNLPVVPDSIEAVIVNAVVRADGTTVRKAKLSARGGSTTSDGAAKEVPFGSSYRVLQQQFELNPADAAPWEYADVNGMQAGVYLDT